MTAIQSSKILIDVFKYTIYYAIYGCRRDILKIIFKYEQEKERFVVFYALYIIKTLKSYC